MHPPTPHPGVCKSCICFISCRLRQPQRDAIDYLREEHRVLHRSSKRPEPTSADRRLWAWQCEVLDDRRSALVIVKPETVIAWNRKGFRNPGQPEVSPWKNLGIRRTIWIIKDGIRCICERLRAMSCAIQRRSGPASTCAYDVLGRCEECEILEGTAGEFRRAAGDEPAGESEVCR